MPALILAPDLSFAGYAAGPRLGALVYNTVPRPSCPPAFWDWDWPRRRAHARRRRDLGGAYPGSITFRDTAKCPTGFAETISAGSAACA